MTVDKKIFRRQRIRHRVRKIVSGTVEAPRLSVFRSNKQIYAQIIDDIAGKTLVSASSGVKELADKKLKRRIKLNLLVNLLLKEH